MTHDRQLMQQVLRALEINMPMLHAQTSIKNTANYWSYRDAIAALRSRLAQPEQEPTELQIWKSRALQAERVIEKFMQPEQEPVAWMNPDTPSGVFARHKQGAENFGCTVPLYTTPQPHQWVGLTEEEINICDPQEECWNLLEVARAIEAKLREKNT